MPKFTPSVLSASMALLCLAACSAVPAGAAAGSSGVIGAIEKKYAITQTTPDREQITKDGTTMAMKCAGVYTMPSSALITPDNKVVDGKVQTPAMMTRMTWTKFGSHVLQTGDKVYITKIENKSESGDDLLRFSVLTVSALDVVNGGGQKKFDGTVSFKFKKGYLDEAPPEEVEAAVEAVLAPDTGDDKQSADNSGGDSKQQAAAPKQQAAAPAPPPPAPAPAAAPAGPPPTITIGETSTEVLQAMGMPQQMIDLGKKKTYVYKNMKIIFMNDKVSDVQ